MFYHDFSSDSSQQCSVISAAVLMVEWHCVRKSLLQQDQPWLFHDHRGELPKRDWVAAVLSSKQRSSSGALEVMSPLSPLEFQSGTADNRMGGMPPKRLAAVAFLMQQPSHS